SLHVAGEKLRRDVVDLAEQVADRGELVVVEVAIHFDLHAAALEHGRLRSGDARAVSAGRLRVAARNDFLRAEADGNPIALGGGTRVRLRGGGGGCARPAGALGGGRWGARGGGGGGRGRGRGAGVSARRKTGRGSPPSGKNLLCCLSLQIPRCRLRRRRLRCR